MHIHTTHTTHTVTDLSPEELDQELRELKGRYDTQVKTFHQQAKEVEQIDGRIRASAHHVRIQASRFFIDFFFAEFFLSTQGAWRQQGQEQRKEEEEEAS